MSRIREKVDVCIIGAGHAGCEAALASARMGLETVIFTVSVDSIALMPCNPNIGGSSKGHLVREIDALGGEMGKNIDKTFIQSKMLNKSKGPAVHSLRAQADKMNYSMEMRKTLQNTEHLTIRQAEVAEIITEDGRRVLMNAYHPLYTTSGWKSLTNYNGYETLQVTDCLKTPDGWVAIKTINRYISEPITTYNIDVIDIDEIPDNEIHDNFYANGILAHNGFC